MELLEGHTLREKLKAGPLPLNLILYYSLQIVEGLSAAHEKEIVHRDLKPENLFVTRDGRIEILDFGLAKRLESVAPGEETSAPTVEGQTAPGMVMGTLGYMSPEQLLAQDVDHRTDLFSFGVVLYEMVARKAPFTGNSAVAIADAILRKPPPELTDKTLPARLKLLVGKLLEKEPRDATRQPLRSSPSSRPLKPLWRPAGSACPARPALPPRLPCSWLSPPAHGYGGPPRENAGCWRLQSPRSIASSTTTKPSKRPPSPSRPARSFPKDPHLQRLWMEVSGEITIRTSPEGADVSYRTYGTNASVEERIGRTPIENLRVALEMGVWRIHKTGFAPTTIVDGPEMNWTFTLRPEASVPADMVPVADGETGLGWPHKDAPVLKLEGFLIDRHEVTNAEYQRFVDSGGYENRKYWTQPFTRNGHAVTPDEAIASFRDGTGRPGPSTWQAGRHPTGQSEHPVSGVSWFEAAAYAEFVGKSLPTVYHWTLAAQTNGAEFIVPGSNFLSDHTQPVGQPGALSGFGTSDMAGNVKEWCLDQGREGKNFILEAASEVPPTSLRRPTRPHPGIEDPTSASAACDSPLRLLRRPPRNWRRASGLLEGAARQRRRVRGV